MMNTVRGLEEKPESTCWLNVHKQLSIENTLVLCFDFAWVRKLLHNTTTENQQCSHRQYWIQAGSIQCGMEDQKSCLTTAATLLIAPLKLGNGVRRPSLAQDLEFIQKYICLFEKSVSCKTKNSRTGYILSVDANIKLHGTSCLLMSYLVLKR